MFFGDVKKGGWKEETPWPGGSCRWGLLSDSWLCSSSFLAALQSSFLTKLPLSLRLWKLPPSSIRSSLNRRWVVQKGWSHFFEVGWISIKEKSGIDSIIPSKMCPGLMFQTFLSHLARCRRGRINNNTKARDFFGGTKRGSSEKLRDQMTHEGHHDPSPNHWENVIWSHRRLETQKARISLGSKRSHWN